MFELVAPSRLSEGRPTPDRGSDAGAFRPAPEVPAQKVGRRLRGLGLVVAGLLAVYAALSYTATLVKGVSFDEGLQLAVGYKLWLQEDYRMESANGDFVKRWATLPYLFTRPNFYAPNDPQLTRVPPYDLGYHFLFEFGNRPESLLRQGRAMVVLLGVATGWLVFWFSRAAFGAVGGLVSLLVFVTSPHMLAFGGIVSTDMSITLTLFGATMAIWQLMHRITLARLVFGVVFFGLLLLAKMTALVIFPITAVLLILRLAVGRPLIVEWRRQQWSLVSLRHQAAALGILIGIFAVAGWTAIWAHYGFRYAASVDAAGTAAPSVRPVSFPDQTPGPLARWVRWSRETRVLPEGYCNGIDHLLGSDDRLPAFMDGATKLGGWRSFFPYAIWVKTQPSLFLLIGLGALGCGWRRGGSRRGEPRAAGAGGMHDLAYAVAPHVVLIVVFMAVAITEDINIGHRHVLPIYPSLYVLAGMVAWISLRQGVWLGAGVGLLLGWRVAESVSIRPHYLAYFSPQVGGPTAGHRHLVDSSLDWGMDLPGLKQWLEVQNPGDRDPLFLAYFGTDRPSHYGIKAQRLPGFHPPRARRPFPFRAGYYAISATLLNGSYLPTLGRWNPVYEGIFQTKLARIRRWEGFASAPGPRFASERERSLEYRKAEYSTYDQFRFGRLCAWLRARGAPPFHVGHSILIWKLSQADLRSALLGPAPELQEPPADWLRYLGLDPSGTMTDVQIDLWGTGHASVQL